MLWECVPAGCEDESVNQSGDAGDPCVDIDIGNVITRYFFTTLAASPFLQIMPLARIT